MDEQGGREIVRDVPWPFPSDLFPEHLGAVIARTVLSGELPALQVVHADDNSWLVGDGVNDPNLPGAVVVAHMSHVIERNSSVASLATLPPGSVAQRDGVGQPWAVSRFNWDDDATNESL